MPSPRCTDCMFSVGEFIPFIHHCREHFRKKFIEEVKPQNESDIEPLVAKKLVEVMELCNIKCEAARSMILNVDTRDDFVARRDKY
jgi:hypothetical protein